MFRIVDNVGNRNCRAVFPGCNLIRPAFSISWRPRPSLLGSFGIANVAPSGCPSDYGYFGIKAHRLNNSYTDVFEVSFLLFIEVIEEGLVLINCNIQRALFQTLVRGNVVRKFNHLNIQALLLGHFCCFWTLAAWGPAVAPTLSSVLFYRRIRKEEAERQSLLRQPVLKLNRCMLFTYYKVSC